MAILRDYAQPVLSATAFIWLNPESLVPNPSPRKYTRALQNELDSVYTDSIRAIGGFDSHSNLKSISKLLGWEGNCKIALLEKIRFYNRVMNMNDTRVNLLLRHRMTTLARIDITRTTKFADMPPRTSSFLWDVYQIFHATQGGTTAKSHASRPRALSAVGIKRDFPLAVNRLVAMHLNLELATSGTASRLLHPLDICDWSMAPYMAEVEAHNTTRDHLLIAHIQAGSHALGSAMTKMYKGRPLCPACRTWVLDDICHQLWGCTAHLAVQARRLHQPRFKHAMRFSLAWLTKFAVSDNEEKTRLVFGFSYWLHEGNQISVARGHLADWLRCIKDTHPTFSKYVKGKGGLLGCERIIITVAKSMHKGSNSNNDEHSNSDSSSDSEGNSDNSNDRGRGTSD
jgi:hypothetical protein